MKQGRMFVLDATVKITYLDNSGFAVETGERCLLFDYYNPDPRGGSFADGVVNPAEIREKRTTVFVSHSHYDHYHKGIFGLRKEIPRIGYVLSDDIRAQPGEDVLLAAPGQEYRFDGLSVRTLRSTDLGVAFLIQAGGLTLYHGGDLNWWHWIGEPEEDNRLMAERYLGEIESLRGVNIDVAFLPMDPRQEHNYLLGLNAFMETVPVRYAVPMHFGRRTEVFSWLRQDPRADGYRSRIVSLAQRGESVLLSVPLAAEE